MKFLKQTLTIATLTTLMGCTDRGPNVAAGDCLTPVDGMQIYKVTRTEGKAIYAEPVGGSDPTTAKSEILIPESMHYVAVDCP